MEKSMQNTDNLPKEFIDNTLYIDNLKIPLEAEQNKNLPTNAMKVFGLINTQTMNGAYSFKGSNKFISQRLNFSPTTASHSVNILIKHNYLKKISYDGRIRVLIIDPVYKHKYYNLVKEFRKRINMNCFDCKESKNEIENVELNLPERKIIEIHKGVTVNAEQAKRNKLKSDLKAASSRIYNSSINTNNFYLHDYIVIDKSIPLNHSNKNYKKFSGENSQSPNLITRHKNFIESKTKQTLSVVDKTPEPPEKSEILPKQESNKPLPKQVNKEKLKLYLDKQIKVSPSVERVINYWNNLGKPFPKHRLSGTRYEKIVKKTTKFIKSKGLPEVMKALKTYVWMVQSSEIAINTPCSLDNFFGFDKYYRTNILPAICPNLKIESWFEECSQPKSYIERKYARYVKLNDDELVILEALKNKWNFEEFEYNDNVKTENCFRIGVKKMLEFIKTMDKVLVVDQREVDFPALFVPNVIDVLKERENQSRTVHAGLLSKDWFWTDIMYESLKRRGYIRKYR